MQPDRETLEAAATVVYRSIEPTPQYCWPLLCRHLGSEVWVKHENHTATGAFKLRGGLVYFDHHLRHGGLGCGVISATRGNHGQSLGFAARHYGVPATVVVPHGNSVEKNAAMRALGVSLVEHGDDFQAAREHAIALAGERGLHMMHSYHPLLVAGVASYATELLRGVEALDTVYVPIGLGSGICGMVAARDALGQKTAVVGVVSSGANAYAMSFHERRAISAPVTTRLADGIACRIPDPEALDIIWRGVERIVTVTDDEVADAMRLLFTCTHNTAEGAGAAATAAAWQERPRLAGRRVAVVLSGGNVDRGVFASVLAGRPLPEA